MKKSDANQINDYYYDAMDCLEMVNTKQALGLLKKALVIDPDSVQTLLGIAEVCHTENDRKKAYGWIQKAYKRIKNEFPVWPEKMPWGDIDNRAYLRVIAHQADFLCDEGEKDDGLALYKLLLKLNPNDNQGIRYLVAGIHAGLTGVDVNRMFDEGNKKQDWSKLEKILKRENKKHKFWKIPKEFF